MAKNYELNNIYIFFCFSSYVVVANDMNDDVGND